MVKYTGRNQISIKNLDLELYHKAKAQAALENRNVGEWISEAIKQKLDSQSAKSVETT